MKELKETVDLMLSDDYIDRFKAEYYQLENRFIKLSSMIKNWDKLSFTPNMSKVFYIEQLHSMALYLHYLIVRSQVEKVKLDKAENIDELINKFIYA